MDRLLTAPGKLFLSGEYAVLWGGVARVLAVGPRVSALVRPRADRTVEIVLESRRVTGDTTPLGVHWHQDITPDVHFVARTIDLALRANGREGSGFTVAFEPSPVAGGLKLGMGSSARAVVLASEASRWATEGTFDALKLALVAHAEAQKGKGSGGDVAACFAGGMVRYRRYDVAGLLPATTRGGLGTALSSAPPVDAVRLAAGGFPFIYAFTGQSASTTSMVATIEATWGEAQRASFVLSSDTLGDELEAALLKGDFPRLVEACERLQALLFSLGPTRTDGIERVLALAKAMGCTGKQSGAGGGDGCLLMAPSLEARAAVIEALTSRGLHAFEVGAQNGLEGGTGASPLARWL